MSRISCLIIETDQEAIRQIDILSKRIGAIEVRWKAHSVQTGIDIIRKHLPEMVIVGLGQTPDRMIESISMMARDFPFLYLVALSDRTDSELILRTIRAGAHDFLCKPVKEIDLRAAAEKAFKLKATRKESVGHGGKILSVFSNKGGNGTTTIAVNLADALARLTGKKVAVVDLVLSHGDVTMFFNVNPSYSILDLAKNAEKADYDFLHTLLIRHASGVYILADPPMIEDAEQISPTQVRDVLSTLRSMFDYIIIDTPHQFDERTLTALEMSDIVLLVSLLNLPSLKNTQKCLELFGRIGLRDERVRLLLSRYLPNDEIPKESIEGIMNTPVFFSVPNDYPTVISSINRGKLLSEVAPDKEVTKSFYWMAELLEGTGVKQAVPEKKKGILDSLFRRRGV
ncbi:AAA family ATPase [Candidatus Deferrimicrobium sp.]|uniref:AAA family ATPase n=1 Tax=Candidatus Deferrimicrobium sp. TaxID=3060586 RepID=UPI002ED0F1C7